jgi:hypothetical protein
MAISMMKIERLFFFLERKEENVYSCKVAEA